MPIEIASAYVNIVPSFRGLDQELRRGFQGAGRRIGDDLANDMRRADFQGAGRRAGEEFNEGASQNSQQGGEQSGEGFLGGLKGKALAGVAGIAAAAGAAFVAAWSEAVDVKAARALTQAQLGISPEAAAALGKQAGQLYSQGYGESLSDAQAAITTVASSLPQLAGDDLTKITGQVLSFSQAFGTDAADAVQSVNTLINSGLAKDAPQALDLLTASAQKVPEALRGNVMEASDEYAQFFNTLGFSGDEAFSALVKGAEKGEFGIDKTGDAIKEFTILSTDGSKATTAAYESIGLNATDMSNAILAGGDSAKSATDQIVSGILGIQDPTEQAAAALAFFGTPLEDMNVAEIPDFLGGLQGVTGGMSDVEGAAGRMDTALGSTTSQFELMYRGVKTKVVDFFVEKVMPAVAELAAWLGEKLAPVVEKVGIWFQEKLVPFLKLAWEWFQVNLLPALQRFGEYVATTFENVMTVVNGIIDFISGVFQGNWEQAWEGIKGIFGGIWDQIKNLVSLAWDQIVKLMSTLGPKIGEILLAFGGKLIEWGGQLLTWLWEGMQDIWSDVSAWFGSLPGWAWDKIKAFGAQLVTWGGQFLQWIWDGIIAKGTEVLTWFAALPGYLWGGLLSFVGSAGGWALDRGKEFIGWIGSGIAAGAMGVLDWFRELPGRIGGALLAMKDVVVDMGKKFVGWVVDGIKAVAQNIWAAIVSALLGGGEFNADGSINVNSLGVTLGGGGARGAVVPGVDPGRRDNVLGRLPNGVGFGLRSGEAVMVPEFTRAIGGEAGVNAWNRLAEQGRLGEIAGGFARGGVVETYAKDLGADLAWGYANKMLGEIKVGGAGIASSIVPQMEGARGAFLNAVASKMGTSYVWGAAGPNVFDCSGLISWALEQAGVGKGRLTAEGFNSSFPKAGEAPGNLVTFDTGRLPGRAGHIGVISDVARGLMMHTDGAGPARVSDYKSRNGGPLNIVDAIGGSVGSTGLSVGGGLFGKLISNAANRIGISVNNAIGPSGETPGGTGVERWRGVVNKALQLTGQSTSWANSVLKQMMSESSGNPNVVNTWDKNYGLYGGSKGLMQVIDPTFKRYALPGYNSNIFDPVSNVAAAIRYVLGTYPEGLARFERASAYDNGGLLAPGGVGVNLLNKPEAVLTPAQSRAYMQHAQAIESGTGQVLHAHIQIGDHEIKDYIVDVTDDQFAAVEQKATAMAGQSWS